MSAEDPFDWWAMLFALLCFVLAAWWFIGGGDVLVAFGFIALGVIGVAKWWWGT